jgi:acyl-coenzyme A thioesterase PaaI-like protein
VTGADPEHAHDAGDARRVPDAPHGAEIADGANGFVVADEFVRSRTARDESGRAREELAAHIRAAIGELTSTAASVDDIRAASRLVRGAVDLLARRAHGRPYEEPAEGALAGRQYAFLDHSPFVGPLNPLAPPMAVTVEGDRVVGTVTMGPAYEGPPGCLHGGFIAALFDELLGYAQSLTGRPGMTGRLTVAYRNPTPLGEPLRLEGWVTAVEGRTITTQATLHHAAGPDRTQLCAEAEGVFVSMRPEVMRRLIESRRLQGT